MSYKFNPFSGNFDIVGSVSGGSGDPGGSTTQVQFNDSGAFGGDSTFTFNKTTDTLSLANLSYTGTLTGGTGVINIGSGQIYKDASGNLGLGVTPSADARPATLFCSGGTFRSESYSATNNQINILGNAYETNSTGFKYINSDFASMYRQTSGIHQWYTVQNGTAGNTLDFGAAKMTLDASGNLLVGAAAVGPYGPNGLLVSRPNIAATDAGKNLAVYTTDSQAQDKGGSISLGGVYSDSTQYEFASIKGGKANSTNGNAEGYLAFQTTAPDNSLKERARIKSTGQVRFVPLASAPSGAETGDVYYNSIDNKLYCYNGSTWNALF